VGRGPSMAGAGYLQLQVRKEMKNGRNPRVLIVDDDKRVCGVIADLILAWGMEPHAITDSTQVVRRTRDVEYDVALIDVLMPDINGLDLIPLVREEAPELKTIVMTGCADKETAISALRAGAFDFLEKPIDPDLLHYSICRAVKAKEDEQKLKLAIGELKLRQSQLLSQNEHLELLNNQLLETNKALSVLAQNIERERAQLEQLIGLKLKSVIFPTIEKLRKDRYLAKYDVELNMLMSQIEDITSNFGVDTQLAFALSFSELRVASLVKTGLTSEDIAKQLYISASTVRTHRRNIRKKLKINNTAYSLRSFLLAKPTQEGFFYSSS
jgi:FixJ family two-component response regulator